MTEMRRAPTGSFARRHVDETARARLSRRLLIDTIRHLEPFKESLTVIGAHAVFARVELVFPDMDMPSTNDADLAVNPAFVSPQPAILEIMAAAGLEPAHPDRPGIYGYREDAGINQVDRTTIDLIVPETYAGAGRRAARIIGQKNAASKAEGIELALHDRSAMLLRPLPGEPEQEPVEVMVAGCAALLVAKAYKVRDRISGYETRPHRLRRKDSQDIGLLMLASDPAEVAATMRRVCTEHIELQGMGVTAAKVITTEYLHDRSGLVRGHLIDGVAHWAGPDAPARVDAWLRTFESETT